MNNKRELKILWLTVVVIWLVLNVFVIRPYLNPTYPDIDRHQPIDPETGEITYWDLMPTTIEGGSYLLPDAWYDPNLKRVYHWDQSTVTSRMNRERMGRAASTIFLGSLLLCFYHYRIKEEVGPFIWIIVVISLLCCSFTFINQMLNVINNIFICFIFVAPFIFWKRIKRFLTGSEHGE